MDTLGPLPSKNVSPCGFDAANDDIFEFQDRIVAEIAGLLELPVHPSSEPRRCPKSNLNTSNFRTKKILWESELWARAARFLPRPCSQMQLWMPLGENAIVRHTPLNLPYRLQFLAQKW